MFGNMILNFQESTPILNVSIKKVSKPTECTTYIYIKYIRFINIDSILKEKSRTFYDIQLFNRFKYF